MSMSCWFKCISEARANAYAAQPALAAEDAYEHLRVPEGVRLADTADLDQSWHMLHYLLTGQDMYAGTSTGPLAFLAKGDFDLARPDRRLAGGHVLRPASVQATAAALSGVTHATLLDAWNDDEMERLGLHCYERDVTTRDYCFSFLLPLKVLFRRAVARGECVAVFYA